MKVSCVGIVCQSLLLLLLILHGRESRAQPAWWVFENKAYYEPLKAEPRAAIVKIVPLAYAKEVDFMQAPGDRFVWDMQLGKEVPVFGYAESTSEVTKVSPGDWAVGVWLPVSFHMTLDHKDPSSPILNTDYRFKISVKAQHAFRDEDRFLGMNLSEDYVDFLVTPWGHESTHLGDEFSLAAQFNEPEVFRRINVSWEYWELGASYQKQLKASNVTFRLGMIGLWTSQPFALGNEPGSFYSVDPREANFKPVTPSNRTIEAFFGQFEYVWEKERWYPFVSIDARMRVQYDYDKASADDKESYKPGVNVLVGLLAYRDPVERGRVDPYVRFYYGVNPHGQFRNQDDYWLIGIGLSVNV